MEHFDDADPGPQVHQVRHTSDGRFYSPNRDFAYVGPALVKQALLGLATPVSPDSPYYPFFARMTPEQQLQEIGDVARTMAHLLSRPSKESRKLVEIAKELREKNDPGLTACLEARTVVLARIGEMAMGCIFAAIQDVTPEGGQPPHERSIESLVLEAERMATQLRN